MTDEQLTATDTVIADLQNVLGILRRSVRLILLTFFGVVVVGGFWIVRQDPLYRSTVSVLPTAKIVEGQSRPMLSTLQGLSSQLGINIGGGQGDMSQTFRPILTSFEFFVALDESLFVVSPSETQHLDSLLAGDVDDPEMRREVAFRRYSEAVLHVDYEMESGVSEIAIEFTDPEIAAKLANMCASNLGRFVQRMKDRQNEAWLEYLQARALDAGQDLAGSEAAMRAFLEKNRSLSSPLLQLERDRLQREVDLHRQVYLAVEGQLQNARLEAHKSLPLVTILDYARPAIAPFYPRRVLMALIVLILALSVGIFVALVRNFLSLLGSRQS
jgi:capsule polysaccharide export protein KpsE/RkpR